MLLIENKLINYLYIALESIMPSKSLRTTKVEKGNCHGDLYIACHKKN